MLKIKDCIRPRWRRKQLISTKQIFLNASYEEEFMWIKRDHGEKLKNTPEKTSNFLCALMSSEVVQLRLQITEACITWKSKNRQKIYIFTIAACCDLTDPKVAGTFLTWSPPKSLISPSSGELSPLQQSTHAGWEGSLSVFLSQTYHRRLWLLGTTWENSHFFGIPWTSASLEGGEKTARQDVWKRGGTRQSVTASFSQLPAEQVKETVAVIADNQKLGCNCLSYLEKKRK